MRGLLGVAILVRGAVVRGPVVLEVRCLEQGLPNEGGSKPWPLELVHSLGEGLDGWGGGQFRLPVVGEVLLLVGALAGTIWATCRPTKPNMPGLQ